MTDELMTDEAQGGRIFFSSTGRTFGEEDELCVLSVGVDIGSSTSHLVFSRIVLERLDSRYVVTERESFYQSDILLTPYSAEETIDADALGAFIARQYKDAKIDPDEIDTGALILTGVAVRRRNARRIGELFARASRQDGRGLRRRQPGNRDGGLWLGRGGALDPQRRAADQRRYRRRHLEDRGLRRGQGDRRHRARRRRAAGRARRCAPHRAARRGRPAFWRGAWLEARARRDALRTTGASACGAHGRQSVRGDEGRLAARRRRRLVAARSADLARRSIRREFFRRRLRIHLWRRGQSVRRYRPAARRRGARAAARLGTATGAARRAHPRHRDRRLAIYDAGFRQHDLRVAARNAAAAQCAGDRADAAARRARPSIPQRSPRRSKRR